MSGFRPARREAVNCLIAIAGSSGSGKTFSALTLANGLSGGQPFAAIDAENRRMLHYAEGYGFKFDHAELRAPYTPERYAEQIKAADAAGYPVIVIDTFTHEWDGIGGCCDMHDEEEDRMVERIMERRPDAREWEVRAAVNYGAWKLPKAEHRRLMAHVGEVRAHVIFCLRADNGKTEMGRDADGKTEIRPKKVLGWASEWIPITEKRFIYEMTSSFVLSPDKPGYPFPIKLQDQHKAFFPLDQPISEASGQRLAAWAKGGTATIPASQSIGSNNVTGARATLGGVSPNIAQATSDCDGYLAALAACTTDEMREATWTTLTVGQTSPWRHMSADQQRRLLEANGTAKRRVASKPAGA